MYNINNISRAIVYESLHGTPLASKYIDFERSTDDILTIIDETKPELILRCATRYKDTLNPTNFNNLKDKISKIKQRFPDIILIGGLLAQAVDYNYTDDITNQSYTETETYDILSFDPLKFEITTPTKYEIQHQTPWYIYVERWYPDFTVPEFQTAFIHQAQKLIEAGVDGIYIDLVFWQMESVYNRTGKNKNNPYVRQIYNSITYVLDEIKKFRTKTNNIPLLGGWVYDYETLNNPYPFDFLVSSLRYLNPTDEMNTLVPNLDLWNTKKSWISKLENIYTKQISLITYLDWSYDISQLNKFTQIADPVQRKQYEKNILTIFSDFFKSNNIIFAYPIHGGLMCTSSDYGIPCIVKSYDQYNIFDSKAPEFYTYDTIKELMNPNPSQSSIGPIIVAGLLIGGLYLLAKKKKSYQ